MSEKQKKYRVMAIDGPAGSGKSTIAKILAHRLGFIHADSGAIYRTMTYALMKKMGPAESAEKFGESVNKIPPEEIKALHMEITLENGIQVNRISGNDVGKEIRTPDVTSRIRYIADNVACRAEVNRLLREFSSRTDLVIDGRDIGSVVFPDTPFKFFLEASAEIRAERRKKDFIDQGRDMKLEDIVSDIRRRDEQDRNRPVGALVCPSDAILIDTSSMTPDDVLGCLMSNMQIQF